VTTSFLGVALCLVDFLADGLNMQRSRKNHMLILLLSFGPPLLLILLYPGAFIIGLNYAGIFCIILLMLLPSLMAWSGRYVKKIAPGYQLAGGKAVILIELLAAISLLIYGIMHLT
jgi:tyrosine-specific transport protein